MSNELSFAALRDAVHGKTAAVRLRARLSAVDGDGGKVFPPTYAGGVYAVENRRVDGQVVRCVLLDSVQSQANRMEEALQETVLPNWRELPSDATQCELPVIAVNVPDQDGHPRWVTSLTAPHRIHDAILRDSNLGGTRFRESEVGQAIVRSRLWDATALYRYCPTALVFGTWDSTAGEGLNSAKIPRAVVSEIIGVEMTAGIRTGSRIDPLGIRAQAATIYRRRSDENDWTLDETDAAETEQGQKRKFGKGKPSDVNHGNVTPDLARFGDKRGVQNQHLDQLPDVLRDDPVSLSYEVRARDGELRSHGKIDSRSTSITAHAVRPGGVTVRHALHTWTLSLTQLRRLRFPIDGEHDETRNTAARTVLAALALYALALQQEQGYWLRSRCELIPDEGLSLELVGGKNGNFALGSAEHVRSHLLMKACQEAGPAFSGLRTSEKDADQSGVTLPNPGWEQRVIRLTPTDKLVELVRRSDARRPDEDAESEEAASAGAED